MVKLSIQFIVSTFLISGAMLSPVFAENKAEQNQSVIKTPVKTLKKPIIAVVKADWCPACKKIDPTIKVVMQDYKDKSQWVMLDLSNKKTAAEAKAKVKELGLEDFYKQFGSRTSTVAILDPDSKKVLKVFMAEDNREKYVFALDKAIADLQE